jgi:hypothetical protein
MTNRLALAALASLVSAAPLPAADPEPSRVPELARLQRAYWEKVAAELGPVRQRYVEALNELEKSLIAKGELEAAGEVRAEREIIAGAEVYAPGYAPSDREKPVDSAERLAEFLVGTRWELVRGTLEGQLAFSGAGALDLSGKQVKWKAVNERVVVVSSSDWVGEWTLTFNLALDAFGGRTNVDNSVSAGRLISNRD